MRRRHGAGVCRACQSRRSASVRSLPRRAMRETGGEVAVGGRDRLSMIYFGQSRNGLTLGVQLDVGSRIPIATTAMGRAYIWALPADERAALLRELRDHYGSRWPKHARRHRARRRNGGEVMASPSPRANGRTTCTRSALALKLNDGTGPYAFNCGAPAFRFTEDRLINDIGPRLVAMVRNIEAALGGAAPPSKKDENKKVESRRESCTCWLRGSDSHHHASGENIRTASRAP